MTKRRQSTLLSFGAAIGISAFQMSTQAFAGTINSSSRTTYVVQGNATFWTISKQLNIRLGALLSANPTTNPLNLYPGLTIKLPQSNATQASANMHAVNGMEYSQELSCVATAYTSAPSENGWGPVDYFGDLLKLGTIAVDPKKIPLGSTVYVKGYTFDGLPTQGMLCHATDEGSAIKGNRIDIYLPMSPSKATNFGLQNVKVYVLNHKNGR